MPVVGSLDVWLDESEDEKKSRQSTRDPPQQSTQQQQQQQQSSQPVPQLLPQRPSSDTSPLTSVLEVAQTTSQPRHGEASLPHYSSTIVTATSAGERIGLPIPRSPRSTRGKRREEHVLEPSSQLTASMATSTAPPSAPSQAPSSSSSPAPSSDSSPYSSDASGRDSSDRRAPGPMHRRRFSLLSRQLSQSATLAETESAAVPPLPATVVDPYSDMETATDQLAPSLQAGPVAGTGAIQRSAAAPTVVGAAASLDARSPTIETRASVTAAAMSGPMTPPEPPAAAAMAAAAGVVTVPLDLDSRLTIPGAVRADEAAAAKREPNTGQQAVALTAPMRLARVGMPCGGGGGFGAMLGSVVSSSGGNDSSHGANSSSSSSNGSVHDDSIRGSSSGAGDSVLGGEAWTEQLLAPVAAAAAGNHPPPLGRSDSPGDMALHGDRALERDGARNGGSRNGGRNGGRGRGDAQSPPHPASSSLPGRSNTTGAAYPGAVCGPFSASPRAALSHSLSHVRLTPGDLSACTSLIATAAISAGVTLPLPGLMATETETITSITAITPTVTAPTATISPSHSELEELRPNDDYVTVRPDVTAPAAVATLAAASAGGGGATAAVSRVVMTSCGSRLLPPSNSRHCTAMSITSATVPVADAPAGPVEATGLPTADVSAAGEMQPHGVPGIAGGGPLDAGAAAGPSSGANLLVTKTDPIQDNATAAAMAASGAFPASIFTAAATSFAAAATGVASGHGGISAAGLPSTSVSRPSPPVTLPAHTPSWPQPAFRPSPFSSLVRGPKPAATTIAAAAATAATSAAAATAVTATNLMAPSFGVSDRPPGLETSGVPMSSSEGSEGFDQGSLFGLLGPLASSLPAWPEAFEGTLRGGWPRRDPARREALMRQGSAPAATVLSVLRRRTSSSSCTSASASSPPPPSSLDGRVE